MFLHALSRPSTICPFPPHGWSAPDGPPLLLRKHPIWAAGDTPHLMPVEQGLLWHPVATGLAGQAIPFIVAASHAHALPSAPFWFPVPAVLVASPALLCPSSLFAVLALVPPGVAPAFCVSVLLLPLSVGAPGCPCRAPPPVPSACPPGSLGVRRIWWLLQCSHLMVPLWPQGPLLLSQPGSLLDCLGSGGCWGGLLRNCSVILAAARAVRGAIGQQAARSGKAGGYEHAAVAGIAHGPPLAPPPPPKS